MKQAFLVDDSKSARIVLSRLLKKNGFDEVEMAESGEQALEQLKAITPDAIFVDFLMDGMDGLETITEIKKDPRFVATPVVMCTANEGDEYVRAAVDHGALGILAKPPTDESISEIIGLIEQHQMEVAANDAVAAPAPSPAPAEAAAEVAAPVAGLTEAEVRRIAGEIAAERAERTEIAVAEAAARAVAEQLETSVTGYLEERLEPLVGRLIDRRIASLQPPEVDTDALRDEVVQRVNGELEEFVRQLNQRTVEGLIEASIYEQINEVANDFAQRLKDLEQKILSQVPEKNEMIEHIRVITEGSLEAHVREMATNVAQEISNSVATETVENLLDQHLAHQSLASHEASSGAMPWVLGLLAAAAVGLGLYFYFFV